MHARMANKTVEPRMSMFAPDTRLFRPDADLLLVFLSGNGVVFLEPTMDSWYRGSIPYMSGRIGYTNPYARSKTLYRPDEAASPMGCIQQYQYCNAELECGELASFYDSITAAAPFLNSSFEEIGGYVNVSGRTPSHFSWFQQVLSDGYDFAKLLNTLGAASLVSYRNSENGYFGRIPSNQWKLDVTHWWTTLLAAKQAAFVSAAHGPTDPLLFQDTLRPENEYMEQLCRNQVRLHT